MRLIKSWQFIFLISIAISLSLLFSVLYKDATGLPKDDWSKAITLDEISGVSDTANYYQNYFDVLSDNDNIYISSYLKGILKIDTYDAQMKLQATKSFDLTLVGTNPATSVSFTKGDEGYTLLAVVSNALFRVDLSEDLSEIVAKTTIESGFENIVVKDDAAVYAIDNTLFYYDSNIQTMLFYRNDLELFDFDTDYESNMLYLSLMTFTDGKYYGENMKYDLMSDEITPAEVISLKSPSSTVPLDVESYLDKDMYYTLYSMKNTKYGQNINDVYIVSADDLSSIRVETFQNESYTPLFKFERYNEQVVLLYCDASFIGKTDVGSQTQTYTNVLVSPSYDDVAIPLTNTQFFTPNSILIQHQGYEYLFTNECPNGVNKLYVNANEPTLIKQSQLQTPGDVRNIFFNALTYIPASLMALLSPMIMLLFPVVLVLLPISIFKMSWAEKNQKKMLWLGIGIYVVSKAFYLFNNASDMIISNVGLGAEPIQMASMLNLMLVGIFTLLISLACLNAYTKQKAHPYFITQFAFFYALEIVQFLFYFMVYTIMFL